jgi:hypothetical protein
VNVAFAIDHLGRRVDERSAPTTESGSNDLLRWARQLGPDRVWGIEGTGSYGARAHPVPLSRGRNGVRGVPAQPPGPPQSRQVRPDRRRGRRSQRVGRSS